MKILNEVRGTYKYSEIAIKKLNGEQNIQEFIQEAETMMHEISLNFLILHRKVPPHPNVVLFRGVSLPLDPVCIVTEYCSGGSLYNYLKSKKGKLEVVEMKSLAVDIAKGMVIHI